VLAGQFVLHGDGGGLDRDAALPFQVHVVQDLVAELAGVMAPTRRRIRSASVLLPWSMWAMMLKLRTNFCSIVRIVQVCGLRTRGTSRSTQAFAPNRCEAAAFLHPGTP